MTSGCDRRGSAACAAGVDTAGRGATPTPAQTRDMIEKAAGLYEGMRIGNAEMRGLSMETPQGPLKLSAIRFNLENGKVGEFAFEGLDARSPNGPVKVGRFALKSLDIANLLRMSAQFSDAAQRPSPDQALGMLALLEGVELKGLVAPYKKTGKPVSIDTVDLSWGQFVGPIPSRVRLTAKMAGPVDKTDPAQTPLVQAGMETLAIDFDLGAAWTEASRTFVLEPVAIEIGSLLKATARVSLANVPRGVFSLNPAQATSMAAQIEAGTLELALRDLGGVDLAVAQFARAQDISRDAARRAIVDNIRANGEKIAGSNPDAVAVVEALIRFDREPGANADHQADAARQGAGAAAHRVVAGRAGRCAGAIPDRGFDGAVSPTAAVKPGACKPLGRELSPCPAD